MSLSVRNLTIRYGDAVAAGDVSFALAPGRCLGIVGESGSGKSQTGLAIMGLLSPAAQVSGDILVDGKALSPAARRETIAMVFQDPQSAFCPHMRIQGQIYEAIGSDDRPACLDALARAGLPDPERVARSYPHELSGGMRQRAMLAMALARTPDVIIADEPTTALDASVQLGILREFTKVKDAGTAMIVISHDIGVIAGLADDILVMKDGAVIESGGANDVLTAPQKPYTQALIAASVLKGRSETKDTTGGPPVLAAKGLSKDYPLPKPHPFAKQKTLTALASIDMTLTAGETLAIVGESGSGKSTLANLLLGLETPTSGDVLWSGQPFLNFTPAQKRAERARIQPVFQDPFASFDPQRRLGRSIQDMLDLHGGSSSVEALLEAVNLPPEMAAKYPHEASGGQNQRAAIARALAADPEVLVCDEALSALDKTTQVQIIALLADIKRARGLAMLFISHDLDVVSAIADRIVILKDGHCVEQGTASDIFAKSQSPYTRALINAQTVPDVAQMQAKIKVA
ncbi:MAG: ABC transporter ATP-binding protein [Pseudomonadota bacterium]